MERGLITAFAAVILWGFLDGASRFAVTEMAVDPWMFSCINLLAGSVLMLLIAGRGHSRMGTLYHAHTWFFGFFRVLMTLFLVFAFTLISASEVNFMLRINVVLGMLAAYLLFNRKIQKTDIPGGIILVAGFLTIALRQQDAFLNVAVVLVLLAAVCDTILTVIAETHPVSNRATGIKARLRYTGFVLLVSSLFFIAIAVLLAQLKSATLFNNEVVVAFLDNAPEFESFSHPATWMAGILVGIFLRAPSMYLYLYAARLLKTENLMMAATLAPFATLGAEGLFFSLGLMPTPTLDKIDVFAGAMMTFGALSMVFLRAGTARKKAIAEHAAAQRTPDQE